MFGAISAGMKLVMSLFGLAGDRDARVAGRNEQKLEEWKRTEDARERMRDVEPGTVDSTVDRLRKGGF